MNGTGLGPKLSIAICTYNQSEMLQNTLDSINHSVISAEDIGIVNELIVVDNNSKDNTKNVCDSFAPRCRFPFKYYFEAKQGLSHARNRAISEATGEIIVFTDDDVVVAPDWLQIYINVYRTQPGLASVFGKVYPEWRNYKPEWFHPWMNSAYALLDYGPNSFFAASVNQQFYGANFSMKLDKLRQYGGFNTTLGRTSNKLLIGEETEIFRKLLDEQAKILYEPASKVGHVIREERKTKEFLRKYFKDIAQSNAYLSILLSKRNLFSIPLFKYKELFLFYLTLPYQYLRCVLTADKIKLFRLQLKLININEQTKQFINYARNGKFN